jgi:hypothetical protein
MNATKLSCRIGFYFAVLAILVVPFAASAQVGPFSTNLDHYTCYKGKVFKPFPGIKDTNPTVTLNDSIESGDYTKFKESGMCLPTDKNSESMIDDITHMKAYKIKGLVKHPKTTGNSAYNQLGKITLDTIKVSKLLVPATKDLPSAQVAPAAPNSATHNVDHYKCYKAKVTKGTPKMAKGLVISLSDQWEAARDFEVKKPAELCIATDKNGEGIQDALGNLVCYKGKFATKHTARTGYWFVDQLIAHKMDSKKEDLVCLPSLVDPAPEFCGDHITNQSPFEECDAAEIAACALDEVCSGDCLCTQCGNGIIDSGETCEDDSDCLGTEFCDSACACTSKPALGNREITFDPALSSFSSAFLNGASVGTPAGSVFLTGGIPDADEIAPLTSNGPSVFTVDVSLGAPQTVCYQLDNCVGFVDCDGGSNVDTSEVRDSLSPSAGACTTGSTDCPTDPSSVCCDNACEGVAVGSGNTSVLSVGVNANDSGPGAAYAECEFRTVTEVEFGSDCTQVDFNATGVCSEDVLTTCANDGDCAGVGDDCRLVNILQRSLTTGNSETSLTNHCAGSGALPNVVPTFSVDGTNFDCSDFTTTDGPGAVGIAIPTEEPTPFIGGDGANALLLVD